MLGTSPQVAADGPRGPRPEPHPPVFAAEAGQGLRPPKGRTWGRRGRTPVAKVTAAGTKRVSMAALICTKAGRRPRLIYRIHQ